MVGFLPFDALRCARVSIVNKQGYCKLILYKIKCNYLDVKRILSNIIKYYTPD